MDSPLHPREVGHASTFRAGEGQPQTPAQSHTARKGRSRPEVLLGLNSLPGGVGWRGSRECAGPGPLPAVRSGGKTASRTTDPHNLPRGRCRRPNQRPLRVPPNKRPADWLLLPSAALPWQPGDRTRGPSIQASGYQPRGPSPAPPASDTMSVRTLPLLFLNLGGEMLYILDQRLRAQNIPGDKARKGERHPAPQPAPRPAARSPHRRRGARSRTATARPPCRLTNTPAPRAPIARDL